MKVLTVIGARPQFIKAAAVSREIARTNGVTEKIVHTGQHYDSNMSDVFFQEMGIPAPDYSLNIHGMNHGAMTGQMLEKIETLLLEEKPDWVLVYGDTNTTLAGALAAAKQHFPVAHVEAGLRSFNMRMPEEINRALTDRVSTLLCCPTDQAVLNLRAEGYERLSCRIEKSGDVMQDAALYYAQKSAAVSNVIERLGLQGRRFAVCTIHRAENTEDENVLRSLFSSLDRINREIRVVAPLHPRTKTVVQRAGIRTEALVCDPVGYFDMIELLTHCSIVLTDSGGLQKEAFFFGKPCVTLREETEWVELVEHGYNVVAGTDEQRVVDAFHAMLGKPIDGNLDLYGGGHASRVIVRLLKDGPRV
jgi:UDP-GlcNAc3NAcA epimerase